MYLRRLKMEIQLGCELALFATRQRGCEVEAPGRASLTLAYAVEAVMHIKRTILAPAVLILGSAGVLAGSVVPIAAYSSSVGSVVTASSDPGTIGVNG